MQVPACSLYFPAKISQLLTSCTVVGSRDVASHITLNKAIGTSVGFGKLVTGKLQWPLFSKVNFFSSFFFLSQFWSYREVIYIKMG